MKKLFFCLVACVAYVCACGSAQADLLIVFSDGSSTATNFDVTVNSTNTFFLLIIETDPNTELSTDGLVGFGLKAGYSAISGAKGEVTAAMVDPGFNTSNDESFNSTELNLAGSHQDNEGFPTGTLIALGQFDFNVTAEGVTEFVFDDYSALSDFVTSEALDLDPIIFDNGRTFSMTITAIPEPGTIAFLGLVGLSVLARRNRAATV